MPPIPLIATGAGLYGAFRGMKAGINRLLSLNDIFSPEEKERILAKYREQIGLGADFNFSAGDFDTYMQTRKESLSNLESIFKDNNIQEAIKKSTAAKEAIQQALAANPGKNNTDPNQSTGSLIAAQQDYEENVKLFGKLLERKPPFKAEQLIQTMSELRTEGVKSIQAQHAYEISNLTEKFNDSSFLNALKEGGITDIEATKKSMLADLAKAHASQLKTFEDSTAASTKKLHDASRQEMERIMFLASISKDNEKMQKLLKSKASNARAQEKRDNFIVLSGQSPIDSEVAQVDIVDLDLIKLSDLDTIHTRTGKEIKQLANNTFTLDLGSIFSSPIYHLAGNGVESDLEVMARAVKSQGYKGIVMDISFKHPDNVKRIAQQAYQACINAGFPPDKIKIKHEGKEMSLVEIFGNNSSMPQKLKQRSDSIIASQEKLFENDSKNPTDTASVKAALKELRSQATEVELIKNKASTPLATNSKDEEQEIEFIAPGKS